MPPTVLMMRHLEETEVADRIDRAVRTVVAKGLLTRDLGGSCSTTELTEAVVAALDQEPSR